MAKLQKNYLPNKMPASVAADKVSQVIHSCTNNAHLKAADQMVHAYRKMYFLHSKGLYWTENLCAELQLKRIVVNHLSTATA